MSGLRSFLAVLVGLVAVFVFSIAGTMLAVHVFLAKPPDGAPVVANVPYLAARIVASLIAGGLGGTICAAFAQTRPLLHGASLGVVILTIAAVAASTLAAPPPGVRWQGMLVATAAGAGAISGSLIWRALAFARRRG